jgi:type VI secretion system lysozyme-like protein
VSGPRLQRGAPVPLFDRLVDTELANLLEIRPLRRLDHDGLVFSIAAEISLLLNTRAPLATDRLLLRARGTLDYGLPDLSQIQPLNPDSRAALAGEITRAIEAYEPRLLNPQVRVELLNPMRRARFRQEWSDRAGRLPVNNALRRMGARFTILPDEHDQRALLVQIDGAIKMQDQIDPVSFALPLHADPRDPDVP